MDLPGLNHSAKQRIKCLAQGHKAVPTVRLEPATPQSRVKHSTTESPCPQNKILIIFKSISLNIHFEYKQMGFFFDKISKIIYFQLCTLNVLQYLIYKVTVDVLMLFFSNF